MNLRQLTAITKKVTKKFPGKQWKSEVRTLDLVEEVGELCNAILVEEGHKGRKRAKAELSDSVVDVLFDLLLIADLYKIDIDKEYSKMIKEIMKRKKEKKDIPIKKIMSEIRPAPGKPLIMQPGDFIITTTEETIEVPPNLAARIDGRSSLARLGIVIHITAARFDPGWKGKAVMELGNLGTLPVALYPGMRICAITFETLSSPSEVPYLKQKDHKYAHQKSPRASRVNQEEEFKKE